MKRKPRALVILAAYNGEATIEAQIESIINQIGVDISILLNIDKSSDATESIAADISHQFPGQIYIRNTGIRYGSAGANFKTAILSVNTSSYDFIAFADQDDIWWEDKMLRACSCIEQSGSAGYSSAVEATWGKRTRILSQSSQTRNLDYIFEGAGQGCTYVFSSVAFAAIKSAIEAVPATSKMFHHDWLCYLVLRRLGHRWYFDSRPSMSYLQSNDNETGARYSLKGVRHRFSLIRSGWYREQIGVAVESAVCIGQPSDELSHLEQIFNSKKSMRRSFQLACISFSSGRRKIADRVIVCLAALFGAL